MIPEKTLENRFPFIQDVGQESNQLTKLQSLIDQVSDAIKKDPKNQLISKLIDQCWEYSLKLGNRSQIIKACAICKEKLPSTQNNNVSLLRPFTIEFDDKTHTELPGYYKKILPNLSPYFKTLFEGSFVENKLMDYQIGDIKRDDFEILIGLLEEKSASYSLLENDPNKLMSVLETAQRLNFAQPVKSLIPVINQLIKSLNPDSKNFWVIFAINDNLSFLNLNHEPLFLTTWNTTLAKLPISDLEHYTKEYGKTFSTLDLQSYIKLEDAQLERLIKNCPNLSSIFIRSDRISDASLKTLNLLKNLTALDLSYSDKVSDEGLKEIAQLKNLTALDLSGCKQVSDKGLKEIVAQFKNLTTLNLSCCDKVSDEGLKEIAHLKNLRVLDLSGCKQVSDEGLKAIVAQLKNLTALDLSSCKQVSDRGLKEIVAQLKNLTTLNLCFCDKVSDEGLKEIGQHLKNLTTLNLIGCNKVSDEGLKEIAQLKNLRTLQLIGCYKISDKGLKEIGQHLKNLTTLNFSCCDKVSDEGLKELAQLKNLTTLDLSFCDKVSDEGLKELAQLKNLTTLNLSGCKQVSDKGLKEIVAQLKQLTTLYLIKCNQVSDKNIIFLKKIIYNVVV